MYYEETSYKLILSIYVHAQVWRKDMIKWLLQGTEIDEEKEMATHSSTLAWKIPWMEEPGRLQSMGSLRVGHDWAA